MVEAPSQQPSTLVIQSFRPDDVPSWMTRCMATVSAWARARGYTYRFIGDELFAPLPVPFRLRTQHQPSMMADLGRLLAARAALAEGFQRVVWLDADIVVFAPDRLVLPHGRDFYLCRELWIEPERGGVRVDSRINNAGCVFGAGTSFLPFYIDACQAIIAETSGRLGHTAIATQFLTALDRALRLPVIETIGLTSPHQLRELALTGTGPCIDALRSRSSVPIAAVNLCNAFRGTTIQVPDGPSWVLADAVYEATIDRLLATGAL